MPARTARAWCTRRASGTDAGTRVTLFADGDPGYSFVSWSGTGLGSYSGARETVAITPLGPVQEIAHFVGQDPVTFHVIPAGSGSILFDGSVYSNGQSLLLGTGTYPLSADPAAGWELVNWSGSGSVDLTSGNATIEGPSVINVTFEPALELTVVTAPAGCGSLAIAGNIYGNGGANPLAQGLYPFAALPCANFTLTSIVATGGVTMAAGRLSVMGNGSLIATFSADAPSQTIPSSSGTEGTIPLWIPVLIALAAAAALLILLFATRRRKSPPAPPAAEVAAPVVAASAPTAIDTVVVPIVDPRPPWSEELPGGDPSTVTFPV